jgi:hypothetical protein
MPADTFVYNDDPKDPNIKRKSTKTPKAMVFGFECRLVNFLGRNAWLG